MKKIPLQILGFLAFILAPAAPLAANADLSIPTHSHTPAQPAPNDYIVYSFTIHNSSTTDAASNVTATVASTGSQFFDSGNPFFFSSNGDGTLTATVGTIAAGADVSFTVKYFAQTGSFSVTATVSSPDDPDSSNNSATESTSTGSQSQADLEVQSVTVTPDPGQVNGSRTYHGTVKNNGPDAATNVSIGIQADSEDQNGIGFDFFESFTGSNPSPTSPDPDANGLRFIPLGNIPVNGTVSFDAFYTGEEEGTFSRNFFLSLPAGLDPNSNNNNFVVSTSISGTVTSSADINLTIASPSSVTARSNISYQYNVFNAGPTTATGVSVDIFPSDEEELVSATAPFTVLNGAQAGYHVDLPDLASHVSSNFTFVFKALEPASIVLSSTAASSVQDPNTANNHVTRTVTAKAAPAPVHGGLAPTSFSINGSANPSSGVADTILRFSAAQLGTPAGLGVRVQSNTVAGHPESGWIDLNNGNSGNMTYDPTQQQFILSSLNYPTVNGVFFRAIASAAGYTPDSISNIVGPFNLASSKPRIQSPILAVTGNGPFADLYFRTYSETVTSGMSLRVQQSTTPFDEQSWVALTNGQAGAMKQSNDPQRFYLLANQIHAGQGIFFRAIASRSGFADGISKPNGPYDITSDAPPTVTSINISPNGGGGDGRDFKHPVVLNAGSLTITAAAQPSSGRSMKVFKLLFDGAPVFGVDHSTTLKYSNSSFPLGDHVIEAVAVDDLGAQARLGTNPRFIRIVPKTGSALKAEQASSETTAAAVVGGKVYTVAKSGGVWTDASTWKDAQGKSGVPTENDSAIVGASTVQFVFDGNARTVSIDGGKLIGQGSLNIYGQMTIAGASVTGVAIRVKPSAVCELVNALDITFSRSSNGLDALIENDGTLNIHGAAGVTGSVKILNHGTINWQPPLSIPATAGQNPALDNRLIATTSLLNNGAITSALAGLIGQDGNGLITNDGNSIVAQGGGNLVNTNGSNIVATGGGNLVNTNGSNIVAQGGGNIVAQGGGNAPHSETVHAETAAAVDGFVQTGGQTDLSGINITGDVTLNGGVLSGSGFIYGSLTNNSGYISPGHSPGLLAVIGDFAQGAAGTLIVEEGGATPALFDQLQVGGHAALGGTLDLKLINGFTPYKADTFSPLGFASHTGSFAAISSNGTATLNSTGILTTLDPAKLEPDGGEARNLSTRAKVQTGDNVVIGGFIVTGPKGSTKKVIVRGIGPSLTKQGIQDALSDPFLELHAGPSLIASNDNWKENQAAVKASGVAPQNDLESAIVATLAPGAYTVVLRGSHQARVLVRAIGPSLGKAGVAGALQDPVLELHDGNGAVITNDNWRQTQESEVAATSIPPLNNNESAILITLPPGPYTAIVRGKDNATGVALVEVYNLR